MDIITYALLKKKLDTVTLAYEYKGSADSVEDLPISASTGDLYTVNGDQYVWDGEDWVKINMFQGSADPSEDFKQALLDCFEHVAWIDEQGQDYVDALESALYPSANLVSISAVYTQSGTVYDTDSLDDLKADLVVTATYDDSSTEVVTTYTLSGTLVVGTSTITVSYGGKTTTFTVTVTAQPYITNGLIHHWDAIDNTESGHSASTTTWYDLVGSLDMTPYGTDTSWDNDALVFTGTTENQWAVVSDETKESKTVEVVFTCAESRAQAIMLSFKNQLVGKIVTFTDNSFNVNGSTNQKSYPTGETALTELHYIAFTTDSSGAVSAVYGNGTAKTQGTASHSLSGTESYMYVGGTTNYSFKGKIHAVRMYNRNLSAEEVAHNYASDVTRFSLGA